MRRIKFWGKKCWKSWMGAEFLFVPEWKQSCTETKLWWSQLTFPLSVCQEPGWDTGYCRLTFLIPLVKMF